MSEQKAISGNAYKRQNSGVIGGLGGTIGGSNFIEVRPGNIEYASGAYPAESSTDLQKAAGSRTFGKMTANKYVILGYSSELGGVASTAIVRAGSFPGRSIHLKTTYKTYRQNLTGWNYTTGAYLDTVTVATDNFGADHAATPTLAVPGELTLLYGQANPVNLDYPAKTVG